MGSDWVISHTPLISMTRM